jgi:hypothetical protein
MRLRLAPPAFASSSPSSPSPTRSPRGTAPLVALLGLSFLALGLNALACGGASPTGFGLGDPDAGGGGGSGGSSGGGSGGGSGSGSGSGGNLGGNVGGSDGGLGAGGDASTTVKTTIYAHTDLQLYSMDAQTKAVMLIGSFTGLGGGTGDSSVTDLAVNAAGDVYVNSETVIYKAALPAGGTGSVPLTNVAKISVQTGQRFYALGFTPADALGAGTGEVLIGGDGNGELWSIVPSSGATKDLGNFGADPNNANATLGLSGDVVFYLDATGAPKGLATIRSCTKSSKGTTSCGGTSDYLAGIDMKALAAAYASGTSGATLNAGIYGSPSPSQSGPGTGYADVFGLGVWGGSVYGFTHGTSSGAPASLLTIATSGASAGVGTAVPASVSLSSGWAGAGVTTTVTVTVAPPPPPPTPK